jgi:hypothetical protein
MPLQQRVGIPVTYSDDCEEMLIADESPKRATVTGDELVEDWGCFARFINPFNPEARVTVVHGIHTYGVLGAARLFSDHPAAEPNLRLALDFAGPDAQLWAAFPVPVVGGVAMVPELRQEHLRLLPDT